MPLKQDLGGWWMVYCMVAAALKTIQSTSSVVNLQRLPVQQYHHNFPEKHHEEQPQLSVEDKRFLQMMSSSAQRWRMGHHQLQLPFKKRETLTPTNCHLAEQRVLSLKRKSLKQGHNFPQRIQWFPREHDWKGTSKSCARTPTSARKGEGVVHSASWCMPSQEKKLCVAFDCSKVHSWMISLSNNHTSPHSLSTRASGYHRWHSRNVSPSDSNFLRSLWWSKGDVYETLAEYKMTAHLFRATSSSSCAS